MDLMSNTFLLPGPVKMHPRVLNAMAVPARSHRDADFSAVISELRELLKYGFQTSYRVCLLTGSGSAGMEAAVSNLVERPIRRRVEVRCPSCGASHAREASDALPDTLCVHNGKFGRRFFDIASVFGSPVELRFEWGQPVAVERVAAALDAYPSVKVVTLTYNESSTGMTNPAKAVAAEVHKRGALFVVDGITAVGGIPSRPEEIGADILVVGSQKCLAAPTGLAALAVSPAAYNRLLDDTSFYLNIKKHIAEMEKGNTPYTPAIPLFLGLREALLMLKEETIEKRLARTAALAGAFRNAAGAMGLALFPPAEHASNTVTAVRYPEGVDDGAFRKRLREVHSVVIAGGQDPLKGKIFRVGHMGITSFHDILAATTAIGESLARTGAISRDNAGAGVRAVEEGMRAYAGEAG